MGQYIYKGFVDEDRVTYGFGANGLFFFNGEIFLRARTLRVDVSKSLEVGEGADPLVQTINYSYNVSIAGRRNVFRYCSPHDPDGTDHHVQHHRHQYDPFGPDPSRETIRLITDGDWPVLGQVIEEAESWYWDNHDHLEALLNART